MKITKTNEVAHPHRNCFALEIEFMHGDADSYSKETICEFNAEKLILAVQFFNQCNSKFKHGMRGSDGFWDVEGYDAFGDYIHCNSEYTAGHASIENIKVFYYDGIGTKYVCIVTDILKETDK